MNPKTWFKGRTYHHQDFKNISQLAKVKEEQQLKVSVGLPTLNVAETLPSILEIIVDELVEKYSLVDQVAIIDSHSKDRTVELAEKAGVEVYFDDEIRTDLGAKRGKGEALWKSLFVLNGDIVIWVDSDIENFHSKFIYGLVGPLLLNQEIQFVKGFYQRPIKEGGKLKKGGGRVTEILARPLVNLFYPELSYFLQPLSGEYGGRRSLLTSVPFYTGYAVEIGLLIEVWKKYGLNVMAQVDLGTRIHHNQPTVKLGKMSFVILQAFLNLLQDDEKVEIKEDFYRQYNLPKFQDNQYNFEETTLEAVKRPPVASFEKSDD
jgi:glucosyl-3-phosphoglycerate synthase